MFSTEPMSKALGSSPGLGVRL